MRNTDRESGGYYIPGTAHIKRGGSDCSGGYTVIRIKLLNHFEIKDSYDKLS